MELLLGILCGILGIIIIILLIKLYLVHRSADEIAAAVAERISSETNTLIDISSRDVHMRRLAVQLNRDLERLRDMRLHYQLGDSELKEAVTNISHDLRTPLAAISGYLELLEGEEKSEKVSAYLEIIGNRTQALKQLTEELFRYSVIVSVKNEDAEALSLNGVLEECLASFYGAMTGSHIVPEITLPEKKVERSLNRSALSRVFGNIITNALKYSDGDFQVEMQENGTITFSNRAAGMDAVSVGKLFDRFFTVESGRSATGLGLAIAKLLTERMGGTITADYREQRLYIVVSFEAINPPLSL